MFEIRALKNNLRDKYKRMRDEMPDEERSRLDTRICNRLLSTVSYRFSSAVLLYAPINSEVNITPVALAALKSGKQVYFPKCNPKTSEVTFHRVNSLDELKYGHFGIPEPDINAPLFDKNSIAKKEDCICLIPALIFDRHGYRVGYGKGYYDRFLSDFTGVKIGIVRSKFITDKVPRGKFDHKVDFIVNDKEVMLVNEN